MKKIFLFLVALVGLVAKVIVEALIMEEVEV